MLRSIIRALVVTALVAAPAAAQFSGPGPGAPPFDLSTLGGPGQLVDGATASTGLTRIDDQIGSTVVVAAPEPASIALVSTGLFGLLGIARRKRNDRLD